MLQIYYRLQACCILVAVKLHFDDIFKSVAQQPSGFLACIGDLSKTSKVADPASVFTDVVDQQGLDD